MELQLLIIVAAVCGLVIISGAGFVALRRSSFHTRVDRRTAKEHEFQESWSKVLDEAERVAQAHKQKSLHDVHR